MTSTTIDLEATVRDGDEPSDTLTGSNVQWTLIDSDGETCTTTGKKDRVSPQLHASFNYGEVTVRLEATDPDGNSDSASHQFRFEAAR